MNINTSTGGPHLLLFERDQQFAALLSSELQLAGYTSHTARTAVEVFDAISRYPIRLVMVDLAQAAAARREFWVALDSQRRDRKVQVLTFLCTNLAGYGPRDLDDHTQNANVDIEIDGMLGLMSLVDAIRSRVPSTTIDTNNQPRAQRFSTPSTPMGTQPSMQMPNNGNSESFLTPSASEASTIQELHRSSSHILAQTPVGQVPASQLNQNPQPSPATGLSGSSQPSYSEKIRAVLYPNQHAWNAQDAESQLTSYEINDSINSALPPTPPTQPINSESNSSQRISGGRITNTENPQNESGLAQLSRLVQGFRSSTPLKEDNTSQIQPAPTQSQSATSWSSTPTPQPTPTQQQSATSWLSTPAQQPAPTQSQHTTSWSSTPVPHPTTSWSSTPVPQPTTPWSSLNTLQPPVEPRETTPNQTHLKNPNPNPNPYTAHTQRDNNDTNHVRPANNAQSTLEPTREREVDRNQTNNQQNQVHTYSTFVIPTTRSTPEDKIGAQPLRASPIQDMPLERTVSGPAIPEMPKRPDVLSRSNYGQQQATPSTPNNTAHLASITTSVPPTPPTPIEVHERPAVQYELDRAQELANAIKGKEQVKAATTISEEGKIPKLAQLPEDLAESMTTNNTVLLDIVQSLPPMPALGEQQQSIQQQVLNGRATRSLNKVLLDGHLVPQDRLDVAQNIQRMLRGVDLNYQLGEILLMFKLLTPDQLLAASLVSYGLITTTQISALGRIRQELYAIGLEYDLENLLIVFRILTAEQLREARSSLQS